MEPLTAIHQASRGGDLDMMKKVVTILLVVLIVAAVVVQPAAARPTSCENFANNVVVGSASSVWDGLHCAANHLTTFLELVGIL